MHCFEIACASWTSFTQQRATTRCPRASARQRLEWCEEQIIRSLTDFIGEDTMRYTVAVALLASIAGIPSRTQAGECDLSKIIAECDAILPPSSWIATPFRGWCYLRGISNCPVR
jgi:hypothetical protein